MKKISKLFANTMIILTMVFLSFCVGTTSANAEVKENEYFTTLKVKATVPNDYDGEIAFVFTQKESGFNYSLLLNNDNSYKGEITILGNMEYIASVTLKTDTENFKVSGLSDIYNVVGDNVTLKFKVTKGFEAVENTQNNDNELNPVESEIPKENDDLNTIESSEIQKDNEDSHLEEPQQIYKDYINAVSFMNGNNDFNEFFNIYDNDIMKKYFMQAESTNTNEDWNKMSKFDKFNYYILFVRTKTLITGNNAVESEEELLDELYSENVLLNKIADGDKVINAIKNVWKYEWKYYQQTGNHINLYDPYDNTSAKKYTEEDLKNENEDKDLMDKEKIQEQSSNDTSADRLKNGVKKNIFSIVILIIIAIVLVVIILLRKKKNYDSID